ncbi:hypothetical protein ACFO1B_51365 [Dactylosporangium siamense]|uniref:Uncharacterized protein n=1 Tax=Dactylosporangium siamense TaxID=685454 RepID=A0A919UDX8_9ACTN|nr:hypothetical protein [Dactylosporangium siamense]GIG51957.1 hypothetical protein Dsi01nite_099980 [Dactylosporangium siamense]
MERLDDSEMVLAESAPECTVPFDDRAGCGVNVERLLGGERSLIGITFVTRSGADLPHDITLDQALHLVVQVTDAIRDARSSEVERLPLAS